VHWAPIGISTCTSICGAPCIAIQPTSGRLKSISHFPHSETIWAREIWFPHHFQRLALSGTSLPASLPLEPLPTGCRFPRVLLHRSHFTSRRIASSEGKMQHCNVMQQRNGARACGSMRAALPRAPLRSVVRHVAEAEVEAATVASTSSMKLPDTHIEASKRALEQLKESAVNR
jgi:hypothetical protein